MKNELKKLRNIFLVGVLMAFSASVVIISFRQNANAAEDPLFSQVRCRKQMEYSPILIGWTTPIPINELEIPTGQATDRTEIMAERIVGYMEEIINAAAEEITAAEEMMRLAEFCDGRNCRVNCEKKSEVVGSACSTTFSCSNADYPLVCDNDQFCGCAQGETCCCAVGDVCQENECFGIDGINGLKWKLLGTTYACPQGDLTIQQQIINEKVVTIKTNYCNIKSLFLDKTVPPISTAWYCDDGCVGTAGDPNKECALSSAARCMHMGWLAPVSTAGACRSETQSILENLEKARSGDFEVFGLFLNAKRDCAGDYEPGENITCWYRKPPGLQDCVLRPSDLESYQAGQTETTGKFLFSCNDAVYFGNMGPGDNNDWDNACWGITRCSAKEQSGEPIPAEWLCPEADDYFCCY